MIGIQDTARTAIITGGANGIGCATVQRFVRDGYPVVLVDIAEAGQAIADEASGNAVFLRADLAEEGAAEGAVQLAMEHFGGLDTVVNNGGL